MKKLGRKYLPLLCILLLGVSLAFLTGRPGAIQAQNNPPIPQLRFATGETYLLVEFLDDDLVHMESGVGSGPAGDTAIFTTPMVYKTDYTGPTTFHDDGQGTLSTAEMRVVVDPESLCSTVYDLTDEPPLELTTICPEDLDQRNKSLAIDPQSTRHVYGLGEKFRTPGEPNGDWVGGEREIGLLGNEMEQFSGGAVGNAQFPVLVALGDGMENYALFVDVVYKQEWEFIGDSWTMTTPGDLLRWFVFTGPDLPDLRADYLELTGRPPVPPKALFGLWVSEYGYDNWAELDDKRQTLDDHKFPQDGFVLDLQWFGGVRPPSQMGSLSWDLDHFPDPAAKIEQLAIEEGVGTIVIEESYIDQGLSNFGRMASQSYLVKACDTCGPATMRAWWGVGGMVDWTNTVAAAFWHDNFRQSLIEDGVMGHWTDLGEPEIVAPNSWYAGLPGLDRHDQLANQNIYNLKWAESIYRGYARNEVTQRPAILSRSGTSGIQRYGAAMWSADIGSNFESLATHMNAQMHMSLSGIDYFGADIGGFHRGAIGDKELDELYTVWFANSALLDVPVRPHTENLCNCKETAPDRVGDLASNLANIRLRYALVPYLYSLAYQAHQAGQPLAPPLFFYFQDDLETRPLGNHKMLGRHMLVRTVTEPGQTETDVYLPAGTWVNYHTGEWIASTGEWQENVPVENDGLFQLPLFLRAGAIVPQMFVDDQTMNLFGRRRDGTSRDELIILVVPAPEWTLFTLFEDDGRSIAYLMGEARTTEISQQLADNRITVEIGGAAGTFTGAPGERDNILRIPLGNKTVKAVTLNETALPEYTIPAEWEAPVSGWYIADGELWVKTGMVSIADEKRLAVVLAPLPAAESGGETTEIANPPPTAPKTTAPASPENRLAVLGAIGLVAIVLLLGGWLYYRRRNA